MGKSGVEPVKVADGPVRQEGGGRAVRDERTSRRASRRAAGSTWARRAELKRFSLLACCTLAAAIVDEVNCYKGHWTGL